MNRIEEDLRLNQQVAYKTLYNSFSKKNFSHAYLLSGSKGVDLKGYATFLAKSLFCLNEDSVFACDECDNCKRIDHDAYCDFIKVNFEEKDILKEDIEGIKEYCSKTPLENKGIHVYIIHLIERANAVALNRLLKFLEEPNDNIFAILTTQNQSSVLPTILSRCQVIRFRSVDNVDCINYVNGLDLCEDEKALLLSLKESKESIEELIESDTLKLCKDLAIETIQNLNDFNKDEFFYYLQKEVLASIKDRDNCKLYLKCLEVYLKEILIGKISNEQLNKVKNFKYIDKLDYLIEDVIDSISKLGLYVNSQLLIESLFYKFVYGD